MDGGRIRYDDYAAFIARKRLSPRPAGFEPLPMPAAMFGHQRVATEFAVRQGRSAMFLSTGLGKTFCQLEWARQVVAHTRAPVLILAPLAVGAQTVREANARGISAVVVRDGSRVSGAGIYVTNYEMLDAFDPGAFAGVVLDESSILKSFTGSTKRALVTGFADTPYRLCCTATPAPNDHMELLNHAEFLGLIQPNEALSRWFINDTSTASQSWRLKGYAVDDFWSWVASWARCASMPSDLGFSDDGFVLPSLEMHEHVIAADRSEATNGMLFRIPDMSATSIHQEKRMTIDARADRLAEVVEAEPGEPWLIWCDTDYEADALTARLRDAIEVRGSMPSPVKERNLMAFIDGRARILVSKPRICGFGLNLQHCARVGFVGLSFSFEAFHQAIRRCWRFGQARPVHVHVAMADTERAIWSVVSHKADEHLAMTNAMRSAMHRAVQETERMIEYSPQQAMRVPKWM